MKPILYFLFLSGCFNCVKAQITTSVIKANFGVEADLSANYYNNLVQSGNDDWFNNIPSDTTGRGVIDTTGAAAINAQYAIAPAFRRLPFLRTMAFPPYTVINNRLLIDAVFVRDYHGDDSTVFAAGASKNGMSPQYWSCPVSQSVPAKNEILDMMVHVRREGPSTSDSLWMFGGISIENTTGDRYFDFEMYQTNITYNRATLNFTGYGPDDGHTSWKFDVGGNIISPGDIIFSADYGSSSLTSIEARIWVDNAALSVIPTAFNWDGTFDGAGAGSQFGYAGISPKTSGAFYTGTENSTSTWAGPFSLIRGDNSVVTNYTAGQFMEFGVNLTKLGLDPATIPGGNPCGMPFRRILAKTRASTAFTASLKDFVAPFDFFAVPSVSVAADTTAFCGLVGTSEIKITNPVPTSTYSWSTSDGHIIQNNSDTSIIVDSPGTYIVIQKLQSVCSPYASDTVVITSNSSCFVLQNILKDFTGRLSNDHALLNWSVTSNQNIKYFEIEKSTDGLHFASSKRVNTYLSSQDIIDYNATDTVNEIDNNSLIYYRLKISWNGGQAVYSKVVRLFIGAKGKESVSIAPNPVRDVMRVNISSSTDENMELSIYDFAGRIMKTMHTGIQKGNTNISLSGFQSWKRGIYSVKVLLGNNSFVNKMVLIR